MTWQKIETAPKDGSVILIAHNRGTWSHPRDPRRINCVVAFWAGGRFQQFGPDSFSDHEIACWMPLPEPPAD